MCVCVWARAHVCVCCFSQINHHGPGLSSGTAESVACARALVVAIMARARPVAYGLVLPRELKPGSQQNIAGAFKRK